MKHFFSKIAFLLPLLLSATFIPEGERTISLKQQFSDGFIRYTYSMNVNHVEENAFIRISSGVRCWLEQTITVALRFSVDYRHEFTEQLQMQADKIDYDIKNLQPLFVSLNSEEPFRGLFSREAALIVDGGSSTIHVDGTEVPFGFYYPSAYVDIIYIDIDLNVESNVDGQSTSEDYLLTLPLYDIRMLMVNYVPLDAWPTGN